MSANTDGIICESYDVCQPSIDDDTGINIIIYIYHYYCYKNIVFILSYDYYHLSLFWLCLCKSVTFLASILDIPSHQPSRQARTFAGTTTAAPAMPSPTVATQVGSHGPHGVSRVICAKIESSCHSVLECILLSCFKVGITSPRYHSDVTVP